MEIKKWSWESHGKIFCQVCGNPETLLWYLLRCIVTNDMILYHKFYFMVQVTLTLESLSCISIVIKKDLTLLDNERYALN